MAFLLPLLLAVAVPRVVVAAVAAVEPVTADTPLTHVPMIMTHDAGSGYLGPSLVDRWTQTQSVGLAEQLACGARAFDARPTRSGNATVWHHGGVAVDYKFSRSVADMVAWLNHEATENRTELVLLNVWDCEGTDCLKHVVSEATAAGANVVQDCSKLAGLTLGGALELGKLSGGGSMLVFTGGGGPNAAACATTHYESSLECTSALLSEPADIGSAAAAPGGEASGSGGGAGAGALPLFHGCWTTDKDHEKQINKMLKQLDGFISTGLSNSSFWQAQAIWQEGADSVVIGTLRNSSLLKDEAESQLNSELAKQVRAGRWPQLNFLEVNNVCDGGPQLLQAIRDTYY
jgi:hypothetical protein